VSLNRSTTVVLDDVNIAVRVLVVVSVDDEVVVVVDVVVVVMHAWQLLGQSVLTLIESPITVPQLPFSKRVEHDAGPVLPSRYVKRTWVTSTSMQLASAFSCGTQVHSSHSKG